MSDNNINTLYSALFDTLQAVRENRTSPDQAQAVVKIAQTIINAAKVEVDFYRATDAPATRDSFFDINPSPKPLAPTKSHVRSIEHSRLSVPI
jgi:hypothetical protein